MGEMRDRMEKELKLRGLSQRTSRCYLRVVENYIRYHNKRPAEQMGSLEARAYVLHLIEEKKLSHSAVVQAVCGLRFFYCKVLRRSFSLDDLPYQKRKRLLPQPLSEREVIALLEAVSHLKYRIILRVSIKTSKGRGESYGLLSQEGRRTRLSRKERRSRRATRSGFDRTSYDSVLWGFAAAGGASTPDGGY